MHDRAETRERADGDSAPVTPVDIEPASEAPDDSDDTTQSDDFTGTWSGTAWRTGNKTWPMNVTFEKHGRDLLGHVFYSDRRCRADWALHQTTPKHWEGQESVKIDPFNGCPNGAQIIVDVIDEESLRWRWSGAGGGASATLQRAQR